MNPLNQKVHPEQSRSNREANSSLRRCSSVGESSKPRSAGRSKFVFSASRFSQH